MSRWAIAAVCALVGCAKHSDGPAWGLDAGLGDDGSGSGTVSGAQPGDGSGGGDSSGGSGSGPSSGAGSTGPPTGPAFLHVDAWSFWWNDRTRCGAERSFLEVCQRRGEADCSQYQQAWDVCDITGCMIDPALCVYGQVGPEQQGNELCSRGKYPSIGGCDAREFDFETLRFWWYGAEWQGNWPFATVKVFPAGADWTGGGELIAMSSLPGAAQAAMAGIDNHGLGYGCAMPGVTTGDDKYLRPFGGFAWVEVPTGTAVTIAVAAGTNFADQQFQGCSRGVATQDPWITEPPGAVLGCVYVLENVVFEMGRHYHFAYGQLEQLPTFAPPAQLMAGFALPEVGVDVATRDACAL